MTDLSGKLDQLRTEANYCAHMAMSATDPKKRELFERLADQLAIEALELEQLVRPNQHLGSHDPHDASNLERHERKRGGGAPVRSLDGPSRLL